MMDAETAFAFDDRAAFGSFLGDLFKASPAGHLQKAVGQQIADKVVAQGGSRQGAQTLADAFANYTPSIGQVAAGLGKTTAIAAPALIAIAAPVAVPAIASALGYAAPTAGETGIAALAATSAVAKPALGAVRDMRGAIDTSGLNVPAPVSAATGAVRAGMSTAQTMAGKPAAVAGKPTSGSVSPASTSSRDALANLLVSVARQVPGAAPPPSSGTINAQSGSSLADVLAVVAKQAVGNSAPPLPAAVTSRVSITPASTNPGLLNQKGFAPVLGVRAGGGTAPRVSRATPSPTQAAVRSIDMKGLPASIVNPVLWTVTERGLIVRGRNAKSLPQWQVYGSGKVARVA